MKILADTDNSLDLINLYKKCYILFERLIKKKVSLLKATSQTLQHKQPSLNSVSLKIIFYSSITKFRHKKVSQIK